MCSSQSQGSVERAHRTLFGQIRTLRAQIQKNYNRRINLQHPLVAWIVRRSAYILNRYAIHSGGHTSYFNRWQKNPTTPLCEFGETVQHMVPTLKQYLKLEQRFFDGIWLGRDESTGEHILRISNRVMRARTVRRTIALHKHNQQLMDVVNAGPCTTDSTDRSASSATNKRNRNKHITHLHTRCRNKHSKRA